MLPENLNQKKANFAQKFEPYLVAIIAKKDPDLSYYLSSQKFEEIVSELKNVAKNGIASQKENCQLYCKQYRRMKTIPFGVSEWNRCSTGSEQKRLHEK